MRIRALAGALALGVPAVSPLASPQDLPEGVELGAPLVDAELGIEVRLPKGGTREYVNKTIKYEFRYTDPGGAESIVRLSGAPKDQSFDDFVEEQIESVAADGFVVVEERKTGDPETGATRVVKLDRAADDIHMNVHYYRRPGWGVFVNFICHGEHLDRWRRIAVPVLRTLRITWLPDDRARPPEPRERIEDDVLCLVVEKGIPPKALQPIREDLAAGVALARELTGIPASGPKLLVHLFATVDKVKAVHEGAAVHLPAALYIPEARCILAHAAPGPSAARNPSSRLEAAIVASVEPWLGTPVGWPAWVEAGLREAAWAARRAGPRAEVALKHSRHARWVRENARKNPWPPIRIVLESPAARFVEEGKPDAAAYALGLLLASRASAEERIRGMFPRGLEAFRSERDARRATATAIEGVDLDALDGDVRALLGKG